MIFPFFLRPEQSSVTQFSFSVMSTKNENSPSNSADKESLDSSPVTSPTSNRHGQVLVRPERFRHSDPSDPHHFYVQKTQEQRGHILVQPSTTGLNPVESNDSDDGISPIPNNLPSTEALTDTECDYIWKSNFTDLSPTRHSMNQSRRVSRHLQTQRDTKPISLWMGYCYVVTFMFPSALLKVCGMPKRDRQLAWREKMGLISVIIVLGLFVSYLTFGFTKTVCDYSRLRLKVDNIDSSYVVANGEAYHYVADYTSGSSLIQVVNGSLHGPPHEGGRDATFLFQNVNGNCHNLIIPRDNCTIPHDASNNLAWYFPCKTFGLGITPSNIFLQSDVTNNEETCHLSKGHRKLFYRLKSSADIFYTWQQIKTDRRNLVVYNGNVLDLNLLDFLEKNQVNYPPAFDELRYSHLQGYDITTLLATVNGKKIGRCLSEIIKIGEIDCQTVGCIAADSILYVSLILILSIVILKFLIACYFRWVVSKKQGAYQIDNKAMAEHAKEIENWSRDMNRQAPIKNVAPDMRPARSFFRGRRDDSRRDFFQVSSKLLLQEDSKRKYGHAHRDDISRSAFKGMTTMALQHSFVNTPINGDSQESSTLSGSPQSLQSNDMLPRVMTTLASSLIHPNAVRQPPISYMPYNIPLVHTLCFVACYSEDEEGMRVTLDSLATTDYPNSHKLIMVICDGLIRGSGNSRTTPEITLGMVEDYICPPQDVKPYSYVAVASGAKRHNMAKVYAGFYKYDDKTVPTEKQQRVPVIVIVKCGTTSERGSAKAGNRGKRDSQVILMSFLERVTFDERMTELEFQILQNIWAVTGLMAHFYETVLMVDADTKVFPDALTHMNAELVKDPSIMGLCGETKIANKAESWVSAIQVFEYYISHHQVKAFESVFGSVTCLPGCFSIYRIKSPKGSNGFWVPILANPDIVERYSDSDTGTLHKKNLLLLGEDRYLSSLMLKTFPKRKQVFVPKAACKTIVPSTFSVLLSQRRRWINSTVHNLFELVLIRDLCGTFCFSMQFVVAVELIGTMILPLAISFTIYVIIFSIVSSPTPVITLILLALILGLPGVLVVITSTSWSYLCWMGIYIIALPIWNFVLPSYAYWKFDDFSWGNTRTVEDEEGADEHGGTEGLFDHSMIKMETWREFEYGRILGSSK